MKRFFLALFALALTTACASHASLNGHWVSTDARAAAGCERSTPGAFDFKGDVVTISEGSAMSFFTGKCGLDSNSLHFTSDEQTISIAAILGTTVVYYYKIEGEKLTLSQSPQFTNPSTFTRKSS